jgi:uncharacterized RDD family membrane protein YckC
MLLISPLVDLAAASGMPWWCVGVVAMVLWAAVTLFLFAVLESSPLRATLGKLICGLAVIGPGGARLHFLSALKRNAVKYSTAMYGLVPLFKSNWAPAGALHDVASGASVVSRKELAS